MVALVAGCGDDVAMGLIDDEDTPEVTTTVVTRSLEVVDTTTKIGAGGFNLWSMDVTAPSTLSVDLSSTNDVDSWLIPNDELDDFQRGEVFTFIGGTALNNALKGSYTSRTLQSGRYHLVVSNRGALLFSRTVTITATLQWEETVYR